MNTSITHPDVSDLSQVEVLAQELDLSLAIAVDREDWILPSMVGVLVANLQVAKLHGRVEALPCHG